jgi:hypothetical protein
MIVIAPVPVPPHALARGDRVAGLMNRNTADDHGPVGYITGETSGTGETAHA